MKFTIIRMWNPNSDSARLAAIERLMALADRPPEKAAAIVDRVRTGIQVEVSSINELDTDDMKQLGKYFQVALYHDKPIVESMQLKLWEVSFIRRNPRMTGTGMVLAETKERAEHVITDAVETYGVVYATEIVGPFNNGRILTTTITSK